MEAQMSVQGQLIIEVDQQVLAAVFDAGDRGADHARKLRATRSAAGGDHAPADQERAKDARDSGERVAFRHVVSGA